MATTFPSKVTLPGEYEIKAAAQSRRALEPYLSTSIETQKIQILDENNEPHQVELPTSALRLLTDILAEMADGNGVQIVSLQAELTTQQAADFLNVSRPHLVKLLETGVLPFHRTGKHRRVKLAALIQYKNSRDRASLDAMQELAQQAQELGMGYE